MGGYLTELTQPKIVEIVHAEEPAPKVVQIEVLHSTESIIKLIRETFPEDPETALAIAKCESGLNPEAFNDKNTNGSTDGGLWQINSVHSGRLRELNIDRYVVEESTRFARMLYERNGWNDWVCYTKNLI